MNSVQRTDVAKSHDWVHRTLLQLHALLTADPPALVDMAALADAHVPASTPRRASLCWTAVALADPEDALSQWAVRAMAPRRRPGVLASSVDRTRGLAHASISLAAHADASVGIVVRTAAEAIPAHLHHANVVLVMTTVAAAHVRIECVL